jgi:hypothetical protein
MSTRFALHIYACLENAGCGKRNHLSLPACVWASFLHQKPVPVGMAVWHPFPRVKTTHGSSTLFLLVFYAKDTVLAFG